MQDHRVRRREVDTETAGASAKQEHGYAEVRAELVDESLTLRHGSGPIQPAELESHRVLQEYLSRSVGAGRAGQAGSWAWWWWWWLGYNHDYAHRSNGPVDIAPLPCGDGRHALFPRRFDVCGSMFVVRIERINQHITGSFAATVINLAFTYDTSTRSKGNNNDDDDNNNNNDDNNDNDDRPITKLAKTMILRVYRKKPVKRSPHMIYSEHLHRGKTQITNNNNNATPQAGPTTVSTARKEGCGAP